MDIEEQMVKLEGRLVRLSSVRKAISGIRETLQEGRRTKASVDSRNFKDDGMGKTKNASPKSVNTSCLRQNW